MKLCSLFINVYEKKIETIIEIKIIKYLPI